MSGDPMVIHLEEGAVPFSITTARQIPFAAREDIKKQLEEMEESGIITLVEGPTKWVHPLVIVAKKDGTWRLCVDLTRLNKYVRRPVLPNDDTQGGHSKRPRQRSCLRNAGRKNWLLADSAG